MNERLSQIETLWSVVRRAHDGTGTLVKSAQEQLLERYERPIRRYLQAALRDSEAADEVYQEFCLKFVKGGFHRANPDQGQFRRFVKRSLYHLIVDHARKQKRVGIEKGFDVDEFDGGEPSVSAESDQEFVAAWREQLLSRTWTALAEADKPTGRGYCQLLRFRVDHPDLSSSELAEAYAAHSGKEITPGNLRVKLHRSRECFEDLLIQEVRQSLDTDSLDDLEDELIELDLLKHCRAAVKRLQEETPGDE